MNLETWQIERMIEHGDPQFVSPMFHWFAHNYPNEVNRFVESISPNQVRCKQWAAYELWQVIEERKHYYKEERYDVEMIGGWFGWPMLKYLSREIPLNRVRNIDLDPLCTSVSHFCKTNFQFDFEYIFIEDSIMNINDTYSPRVVINTSCEHMPQMKDIIKSRNYNTDKAIFVLQSNNMRGEPDHINCVDSPEELAEQAGFTKLYYRGSLEFENYTRYMVIGKCNNYK